MNTTTPFRQQKLILNSFLIASFEIEDSFKLTRRGLVLVGFLEEGMLSVGDYMHINYQGNLLERRIKGIDISKRKEKDKMGILIDTINHWEEESMNTCNLNGVMAEIYDIGPSN